MTAYKEELRELSKNTLSVEKGYCLDLLSQAKNLNPSTESGRMNKLDNIMDLESNLRDIEEVLKEMTTWLIHKKPS